MYSLRAKQFIKSDLVTVWDFISSPENLARITPAYMDFRIVTDSAKDGMYAGQIIEYRIRPMAGLKLRWITEITHVRSKEYFVDEQRFGPYRFWHHQHFLKEVPGGVEMEDLVHYKIPYGIVGRLLHFFIIEKQLRNIFEYRRTALDKLFC